MIRFLRFFTTGQGVILIIVGLIIFIGGIIKHGQDKQRKEAEKRQVQRDLGKVKPSDDVDASVAAKESILSNRKLNPGAKSLPTPIPEPPAFAQPIPGTVNTRAQALPTLVSFYAQVQSTPTPTPEPQRQREPSWLPPSIFIPCALVNTVESSHINTPVVGEVIRDVYQNGKLIVPAGTLVSSFAESGAVRDRIEVAGTWLFVFSDGRHLKATGIACDREADPINQQFGTEDGSAGLQGDIVERDHWANAKAFIALLLTATTQAGTAAASGALQSGHSGGVGIGLPDTTPVLAKYLDQLLNGETGDGRFVQVRASKEFYIFPTEEIVPSRRVSVDKKAEVQPNQSKESLERELEKELFPHNQEPQKNEDRPPHFHY